MVRNGDRATITDATGAFELDGFPIQPATPHGLTAETPDRRKGVVSVIVAAPGVIENVTITLSALGSAEFTVFDPLGIPVAGQAVTVLADQFGLRGACALGCGCSVTEGLTDASGRVRFSGLPAGAVLVRAMRVQNGFWDVASGKATIVSEGHLAQGVLRFEGHGRVEGLVLDDQGRPSVGAEVVVQSRRMDSASCTMRDAQISHRVRSDQQGRFSLSSVGIGGVSISASQAFLPTPVGATLAVTQPGEERQVTLRLINSFAGELSGLVLRPDAVTPAGAGVEVTINGPLPDITVRTNDEGRFRFAKILPAGTYKMTVVDPHSGGLAQEMVHLLAGQDLAREVRLKGRGRVNIRVVDGLDQPVSRAVVRLQETSFPGRELEGIIDEASEGVVTFEQVFEGPFAVDASDVFARGGRAWGAVPSPDSAIDVVVRLGMTGTVRGRFLLPDGTPIPYGIVRLLVGGREIGQATTAGSGEVGAFEFNYVPAGSVRLEAHEPASARTGIAVGTIASEGALLALDVRAEGLGTVTGVVTAGGVPQPAAKIELASGRFKVTAAADGEGRYTVSGVPEGQVTVSASVASGVQRGTATATLIGDGATLSLDVAVRDVGRVIGSVNPAPGMPLRPTIVTASPRQGLNLTFSAVVDEDGAFEFDRLPAGLTTFTADVIGSIDRAEVVADVVGSATTEVELDLVGVGSLTGIALDSVGLPTRGSLRVTSDASHGSSLTVTVPEDGTFRFPALLAGPVSLRLTLTGGATELYGTATATVVAGQETTVNVRLQDSATVTGLVLRADGVTPAFGADTMIRLSNGLSIPVQVLSDGRFTATGVPLGAISVRVTDPFTGGVALRENVALTTNNETLDLGTIVLDDNPVTVVSIDPAPEAVAIAVDRPIVVTFSDALLNTGGIEVRTGTVLVSSVRTLSADGRTVTIARGSGNVWPDSAELTVTATTSVTDIYGRHPAQAFTSRFRTVDLSPPHVLSTTPALGAVEVAAGAAIDIRFHESLGMSTNIAALVTVTGTAGPAAGQTTQTSADTVRFTPAEPLADNAIYQVIVNGAVDDTGNAQTTPHTFSFTTHDSVPPVLSLTSPGDWTKDATPSIQIGLQDTTSGVDLPTKRLWIDGVLVALSATASAISVSAPAPLAEGAHVIQAAVADRSGNAGALEASFGVDLTPPGVPVLTGVSEGDIVRGTITLSASAADALSGVARIDLLRGGQPFTSFTAPAFQKAISTSTLGEGPRTLSVVAYDLAGNVSAASAPINVIVDNDPLSISFTSPPVNTRTNSSITAHASTNEAVERVEFTLDALSVVDTAPSYQATFDTTTVAEGTRTIMATATDQFGLTATATRTIVVDRTGPAAPDITRISAEPPVSGASLVLAASGAIEARAVVTIVNTATGATAASVAEADGSFSASIAASIDDVLTIRGTDDLGNVGASSTVVVRSTPSTPPDESAATLRFEGVLADRVAAGTDATALVADGVNDALFTFALAPNDTVARQLFAVRLDNEDDGGTRSTDPGAGGIVGVTGEPGGAFLNGADGRVSLTLSGPATFTLFVIDGGFIREGATYRATASFTDGSRFVGRFRIIPAADRTQVAHLATVTADSPTVVVPAIGPGTTMLTITGIRDIDGTLVPDGARIALSAANLASKDPRGYSINSAGGTIEGGEPAANHTDFRVFTIAGGTVLAQYTTGGVVPPPTTGAHAVIQVLPVDEQNNVIGQRLISSLDLNIRAASDRATVHVSPGSLYADGADHRAVVTVYARTAAGTPLPDGTQVYLRATATGAAGSIVGGSGYVPFTVNGGRVIAEYSSAGAAVHLANTPPSVKTVTIAAHPALANGSVDSATTLGTAELLLVPAAGAELHVSPASLPWVSPERSATVIVHHVHDLRGHLVPDASPFLLTAASGWKYRGASITSFGGVITDGIQSAYGSDYRLFTLDFGRIVGTYATQMTSGPDVDTGQDRTARVSVMPVQPSGLIFNNTVAEAIATTKIMVVGTNSAVGSANPASVLADGNLRTSTVTFSPVLDAFGNPLPDGSIVLARATGTFQARDASGNLVSLTGWGGQVVNGTPGTGNIGAYNIVPVQNGAVTVVYGTPTTAIGTGETRTAYVTLSQYEGPGSFAGTPVLGAVPILITGATSASGSASPAVLFGDTGDHRSMVTFSDIRDSAGQTVPDGSKVVAQIATSGAGSIVNGAPPQCCATSGRLFTILNGQVVVEYSSAGVNAVGTPVVVIRILPASAAGSSIGSTPLASVSIQMTAPTVSGTMTITPADLLADDGNRQANVVVTNVRDTAGNPLPDGSKVVLRITSLTGVAGVLSGTVAGDGIPLSSNANHWSFTVANGEVRAIFTGTGIFAGPNQSLPRTIDVYAGRPDGSKLNNTILTTATLRLHGTTFATGGGTASSSVGGTATVIFSGIKDVIGNQVPDGAKVIVKAHRCRISDGFCMTGLPGTFVNGDPSDDSDERLYTVTDGAIEVQFQVGSFPGWRAQFTVHPARHNGTQISSTALTGGTWAVEIVP
jgi:hypothetical protein